MLVCLTQPEQNTTSSIRWNSCQFVWLSLTNIPDPGSGDIHANVFDFRVNIIPGAGSGEIHASVFDFSLNKIPDPVSGEIHASLFHCALTKHQILDLVTFMPVCLTEPCQNSRSQIWWNSWIWYFVKAQWNTLAWITPHPGSVNLLKLSQTFWHEFPQIRGLVFWQGSVKNLLYLLHKYRFWISPLKPTHTCSHLTYSRLPVMSNIQIYLLLDLVRFMSFCLPGKHLLIGVVPQKHWHISVQLLGINISTIIVVHLKHYKLHPWISTPTTNFIASNISTLCHDTNPWIVPPEQVVSSCPVPISLAITALQLVGSHWCVKSQCLLHWSGYSCQLYWLYRHCLGFFLNPSPILVVRNNTIPDPGSGYIHTSVFDWVLTHTRSWIWWNSCQCVWLSITQIPDPGSSEIHASVFDWALTYTRSWIRWNSCQCAWLCLTKYQILDLMKFMPVCLTEP